MSRALVALLVAGSLVGCTISEEEFPEAYAEASCTYLEECNGTAFELLFGDLEDCIDLTAEGVEVAMDAAALADLEYDPAEAKDCIQEVRERECGDVDLDNLVCEAWN